MCLKIIVNYCFMLSRLDSVISMVYIIFNVSETRVTRHEKCAVGLRRISRIKLVVIRCFFLSLSLSLFLSLANRAKQQTFLRNFARTNNVVNRRRKWHFAKGKPEVWLPRGRMSRKWDSRWFQRCNVKCWLKLCSENREVLFIVK